MAAIELFNRTKYSDEVLIKALKRAKRIAKVKGDVAVKVLYDTVNGFDAVAYHEPPYFHKLSSDLKRFANRKYIHHTKYGTRARATKNAETGWMLVRVPKPSHWNGTFSAANVFDRMLHEMRHIWQFRNQQEAVLVSGCRNWNEFYGYKGGTYKRIAYRSRPIEKDAYGWTAETMIAIKNDPLFQEVCFELIDEFSSEKVVQKFNKQRQANRPKYNAYGDKVSDYRKVKMNSLRDGTKLTKCPHCGEKAIVMDDDGWEFRNLPPDTTLYSHVIAVDNYSKNHYGCDGKYHQFGHVIDMTDGSYIGDFVYRDMKGVDSEEPQVWIQRGYRW